jgi:hypothetical protein
MTEFDLLHKTELRIERIRLQHADLNEVAAVVADVLDLEPFEVLVTDVVGDIVTLDILRQTVDAYALVGRQKRLFDALGRLPGVEVTQETSICSQGMRFAGASVTGRLSFPQAPRSKTARSRTPTNL